jgi:hypothetical protein
MGRRWHLQQQVMTLHNRQLLLVSTADAGHAWGEARANQRSRAWKACSLQHAVGDLYGLLGRMCTHSPRAQMLAYRLACALQKQLMDHTVDLLLLLQL